MKESPRTKAARIDLDDLSSVAQRAPRIGPATAPGMAMQTRSLQAELAQWSGASPVRHIDPKKIARSKWANRHELSFKDAEFEALKADIESSGGNVQPIKVRVLSKAEGTFEIIFGHRRHQACLDLGIPVLALIGEVTDEQMFIEMDRENRQRKDLRPYEQGLMYDHALKEGMFTSIRKLSERLGVDQSNATKAIGLARLPQEILDAFQTPMDIQLKWGAEIVEALEKRPESVLAVARAIKQEGSKLPAKEVFGRLMREPAVPDGKSSSYKSKITGAHGQQGFIFVNPAKNSVEISLKNIDPKRGEELEAILKKFIA